MCAKALAASQRIDEQKLVIDVLKRYPNKATLQLAIKAMRIPGLKKEATEAKLAIAQKLAGK